MMDGHAASADDIGSIPGSAELHSARDSKGSPHQEVRRTTGRSGWPRVARYGRPLILSTLALAASLLALDHLFPPNLPDEQQLFARVVTDRHGEPLRAFPDENGVWRYPVRLDEVSPRYITALLSYEDRWFWDHPGINPLAMARAAWQNLTQGAIVSGGSTLTMQVARLLHPHPRTFGGKVAQVLRALQLEWRLDKTRILELYLNLAPFGGTLEGVQAASYGYLGKPATQLTLAEAALLAVLPQSPTRLRPDLHPEAAQAARDKVLDRLAQFRVWSAEETAAAKAERVAARGGPRVLLHAPLLGQRLIARTDTRRAIRTEVDARLQLALEDYLRNEIRRQPPGTSAAVLVVENADAAVRAYLGSADFLDDTRFGHVDMVGAVRSPGSTLKPFVYGMAMDDGLIHSHSLLADAPRERQEYRPANFSGGFMGPISAAEALTRSLNVPAVDILERLGPATFAARLEGGGLRLRIPGDGVPNLSLILGGAGATLEALTGAYLAIAGDGRSRTPRLTPDQPDQPRYLLSPQSAWVIRNLLADNPAPDRPRYLVATRRAPGLAWKTGTSAGFRDAWAIGIGRAYTIGVWIGRPDATPSPGQTGAEAAAPLLFAIADFLRDRTTDFGPAPEGVEQATICWPLGTRLTDQPPEQCYRKQEAWLVHGLVPPTWHALDAVDWQGNLARFPVTVEGLRTAPGCAAPAVGQREVALWPRILEPWAPYRERRRFLIPPGAPGCDVPPLAAGVRITGIEPGATYRPAGAAGAGSVAPQVPLAAAGGQGRRHWYLNGAYVLSTAPGQSAPLRLTQPGANQLLVIDEGGNLDQVEIRVAL